jgi:transposase
MRPHPKAKGNPYQRELFVRRVLEEGWSVAEASEAAGWSERTGFKWLGRFREEGEVGLADRRSGPRAARNRGLVCPEFFGVGSLDSCCRSRCVP